VRHEADCVHRPSIELSEPRQLIVAEFRADEGEVSGLIDLLKDIDLKRDDARLLQTPSVERVRGSS
jgi:hypothetical protein